MQTFLFTDIADSSRLWQQYPQEMSRALADHDRILKRVIERYNGRIVKSTGDGVHAAFERIADACWAAVAAQQELSAHPWEETGPLQVRMGLHTGEAERRDGDYYGTTVNKAARLMALAAGGQVLLTEISYGLLIDTGAEVLGGLLIGKYRLKGLAGRTGIYQLTHPDLPGEFPALPGGESVPSNLPLEMTSFIGREREIDQIIKSMLDTEDNPERRRLVTLIGPGGTGKTRLSIQAARQLREAFTDGVWLVELAPLTDPASIPQTVLDVLDLQETPDTPAIKLISTLSARAAGASNLRQLRTPGGSQRAGNRADIYRPLRWSRCWPAAARRSAYTAKPCCASPHSLCRGNRMKSGKTCEQAKPCSFL